MVFNCGLCNQRIPTKPKFHFDVFHPSTLRFPCGEPKCGKQFSVVKSLVRHNKYGHPEPAALPVPSTRPALPVTRPLTPPPEIPIVSSVQPPSLAPIPSSDTVKETATWFLCQLLSLPAISFNRAFTITDRILPIIAPLLQCAQRMLSLMPDSDEKTEIHDFLMLFENPFSGVSTHFLLLRHLTQMGFYIAPTEIVLEKHFAYVNGLRKEIFLTCQYIPMAPLLRAFLSLPGIWEVIQAHMAEDTVRTGGVMKSFIDGKLWKRTKEKFAHKDGVLLPLMHYYDDFQTVNPLGSRTKLHKVGGNYTVILGLPPRFNALLENLLLSLLFNSSDRGQFGNKACFENLIDEYKTLAVYGILVRGIRVFPMLQLCSGDNLSINGYMGFVESFSAHYPCRFCKMHAKDFNKNFIDDPNLYRTIESYDADVANADVTNTGVKEDSVFNSLLPYTGFHVTTNFIVDMSHDILEGIVEYIVPSLIRYLLNLRMDRSVVLIDLLNDRRNRFIYDHAGSKPSFFHAENFTTKTCKLKQTMAQRLNLVLALPLLIGDHVPENDCFWEVFLQLRELLVFLMGNMRHADLPYLRDLISNFLENYCRTWAKLPGFKSMPFKFHALTHYPFIIEQVGPISHLMSIRLEGKHRLLKQFSVASNSFKNICLTIAKRHQISFALRCMQQRGFMSVSDVFEDNGKSVCDTISETEFCSVICSNLNAKSSEHIYSTNSISLNNVIFKVGHVVYLGYNDIRHNPNFYKILFIFQRNKSYFIIGSFLNCVEYFDHYQCYHVKEVGVHRVIDFVFLRNPFPLTLRELPYKFNMFTVSLRDRLL